MRPKKFYAHSRADSDKERWQELHEHLDEVATLATEFASEPWKSQASVAGLWHDVGKYQTAFQRYIGADPEASNEVSAPFNSVPHAVVGAALAAERFGLKDGRTLALALVIEAHHGALKAPTELVSAIELRGKGLLAEARKGGLQFELEQVEVADGPALRVSGMAIRMLFSTLVDADLLNTEGWDRGTSRALRGEFILELAERLEAVCRERSSSAPPSAVNTMRREVLEACLARASEPRGGFTLTVPTGGGKTLSGMAFALRHAATHGMKRVIVVAPYTSILEQTAREYRKVLGDENVVEHHSNLDPAQDTDHNRQACENWDAPVIVTTSVQFFESLYAAHKSRCRKLHRIANSVVLLDEVQTFPTGLLQPIHLALKLLAEEFGASVVHGTATQPLLAAEKSELPKALQMQLRPIVSDFARHFAVVRDRFVLRRVGDLRLPVSIEELAGHLREHPSVLTIVHNRKEAQQLAELLGPECVHLSASMCAEHRTLVLDTVRARLKNGEPCHVVATQLVEAGVDIDFPVVYRALAGLETLAQAAGRCNREMRGEQPGQFHVFRAPSQPPKGTLRLGMQIALDSYFDGETNPDLNDPHLFPKYARRVLKMQETDLERVMEPEGALDFPTVAERFRMIDDAGVSVVAPYGEAMEHVRRLRREGPTRAGFRRLQRVTVSLHPQAFERLYAMGFVEPVFGGAEIGTKDERRKVLWTVGEKMPQVYDPRFGFGWEAGERIEPGHLIA
jgi:CRISPR-associated endonuclease/helicase Cas3